MKEKGKNGRPKTVASSSVLFFPSIPGTVMESCDFIIYLMIFFIFLTNEQLGKESY